MPPINSGNNTPLYLGGPHQPWRFLSTWSPFSFDALGLITLLGEKEVNRSIGSLQRRRFTEFLPLLAGFVIAGDRFTEGEPGFALYNITDGIYTTEIKYWFTRWLSMQRLNKQTTTFTWSLEDSGRRHFDISGDLLAPVLSYAVATALLVITVVMGDWPGIANFTAVLVSMMVRSYMLWQRRASINRVACAPQPSEATLRGQACDEARSMSPEVEPSEDEIQRLTTAKRTKTLFITRQDGKMVTIHAPPSIVATFVKDCEPVHPPLYHFTRAVGWLFFGGHIVVLGMSSLFTQLITVVLLVGSTWLLCSDFDFDTGRQLLDEAKRGSDGIECKTWRIRPFGTAVTVTQENPIESQWMEDRRQYAYLRADPTKEEELMMLHWSLLPVQGVPWIQDYKYERTDPELAAAGGSMHYSWSRPIKEFGSWYRDYELARTTLRQAREQSLPTPSSPPSPTSGRSSTLAPPSPSTRSGAHSPVGSVGSQQLLIPKAG